MNCKNKSCLCYSVETGAVIIGITFMVSTTVAILLYCGMILDWDEMKLNFKDKRMRNCKPHIQFSKVN